MPKLTIDGQTLDVPAKTKIIEAAAKAGIPIPRYCYHPALSIEGNCRMCLVEIEKNPKLQIACHTETQEGMVVRTDTPRVQKARRAVLEFLLLNHPLDCPVCDQAGECELQNFYMTYGLFTSRLRENKTKKRKAVPIGPTVVLDTERCILCSRCVRYASEITRTHDFGIFNRSSHSEIGLYPGRSLDNPYSGNVVDVCPVGALTDRDFRFKCRVWYMSATDSVCPLCARGCNIQIHVNKDRPQHGGGARVMRLKPRVNADVNQWWMCDEGRYGYRFIDEHRLLAVVQNTEHGERPAAWEEALQEVAEVLARFKPQPQAIAPIGSAQMTNEDIGALKKLFVENLKVAMGDWLGPVRLGGQDDFLIRADKNPNTTGVEAVFKGIPKTPTAEILKAVDEGKVRVLYVCGQDLCAQFGEQRLQELRRRLDLFVYQGSNDNKTAQYAHWVLPSCVYAEKEGTFTNFQGRVQKIFRAVEPLGESLPDEEIFTRLIGKLASVSNVLERV